MAASRYIEQLRERIGHSLLLLPGVAALVRDERGHVLLQRRTDDGGWSLPAGGIDPGETPADAVAREVREETGLLVRPVRIAGVFGGAGYRHRYPNGDEIEPTTVVFECAVTGGRMREQEDETAALRWVPADEAAELLPAYPPELFAGGAEPLFHPLSHSPR